MAEGSGSPAAAQGAQIIAYRDRGFRCLRGVFQYSGGVAALPGFAIERVQFARSLPLADGFAAMSSYVGARGRPLTAICAIELRSPAPFTEQGFTDFNRQYVQTLERWRIVEDGVNPVARTNVCPLHAPPDVPSVHAFSLTVPADSGARGSFVIAGGGEARDGQASYRESIVRLGDTSIDGLRDKVRYVIAAMGHRLSALDFGWQDATTTQMYTIHDIGPLVRDDFVCQGVGVAGLMWHFCRPPVVDIEFEMDVRSAAVERVV